MNDAPSFSTDRRAESTTNIKEKTQGRIPAQELIRALVEQAPDAVIFADRNGLIVVWNGAAEKLFGYSVFQAVGKSLDVIIPNDLRAAHWAGFRKAIETGHEKYAGRVLTTRSVHKDGRKIYVDLGFALVKDSDGNIVGALATARDCTERYLAEKALRTRNFELEEKLHDGRNIGAAPQRQSASDERTGDDASDERIRRYLHEHLVHSTHYPALFDVTLEVAHGDVTLLGTVPHRVMKRAIADLAAGCPGVRHVKNKLNVALTAPWPDASELKATNQK